jgi:hypothetical protein
MAGNFKSPAAPIMRAFPLHSRMDGRDRDAVSQFFIDEFHSRSLDRAADAGTREIRLGRVNSRSVSSKFGSYMCD